MRALALITGCFFLAVVAPASAFDVVGARWSGGPHAKVWLRTHLRGGGWTRWARAESGDPVVARGSDRVQVRRTRAVRHLRLRYVSAPRAAHPASTTATKRTASLPLPTTGAPEPRIIPRSAWDPQNRCPPRAAPVYAGPIQLAFVHHTVSLNGYSRSQSASMVLAICLFHRNGNGWNDIGYNFLVDRYGQVFEGRTGGIDQPVLGAHAGGFNAPSTGVSMIGDFSRSAPPARAMTSLAKLLAWKLSIHGVPATGRTTVVSGGGPDTGFRAGAQVTLNRISGHRDADLTECPGTALYRRLPALRTRVKKLEGATSRLSLAAPAAPVPYGSAVALSGRLGPARGGEAVELRELSGGRERVVGTALTAPDGSWSAAPPAHSSGVFRAVYLGGAGAGPGVISNVAYVGVAPVIALSAGEPSTGGAVPVSGTVAPTKHAVTITAYRGSKKAASKRLSAGTGSFSGSIALPEPGAYTLVATVPADAATAAGRSNVVKLQASQQ